MLLDKIRNSVIHKGTLGIFWLGQAGFLLKDCRGGILAIDPYLTESCERIVGFKRLMPCLIEPEQFKPDILICTHDHPDHFDVDAVLPIMNNSRTILLGSKTVKRICTGMNIDCDRIIALQPGEEIILQEIYINAVYADHGELAPDALGILLQIDGIKVYFPGDTAYRPEKMTRAMEFQPDIVIPPINGAYGNLNAPEAAKLVNDTKAKVAIPCHFWTFKEHGGDPQEFEDSMKSLAPHSTAKFMCQGELYIYRKVQ